MWIKRLHTLDPLTKLGLTRVKFRWTDIENKDFIAMGKTLGHNVLLSYHNFSERLIINTDARQHILGEELVKMGSQLLFTHAS